MLERDAVNVLRSERMETRVYKDAFDEYEMYENNKNAYAMTLFKDFNDRNPKGSKRGGSHLRPSSPTLSV